MKLNIKWAKPLKINMNKIDSVPNDAIDLEKIDNAAGIYLFARKWGKSYEALYIGRTNVLQDRIKTHLNNHRLIRHLKDSMDGQKMLIYGYIVTEGGNLVSSQVAKRGLPIIEQALIRRFVSLDHSLVNSHFVSIKSHEINFDGGGVPKSFVPRTIHMEE